MAIVEYALDSYLQLLRPVVPVGSVLAVVDERGLAVWIDEPGDGDQIRDGLARLGREYWTDPAANTVEVQRLELAGCGTLYYLAFGATEGDLFGYLTVVVGDDHPVADLRAAAGFCEAFAAVAACICREHRLNVELNTMANELGERYDELNLVYSINERGKDRREQDCVLVEIVEDCARHMAVPFVSIVVPDRDIGVHHCSANGVRAAWRKTWKRAVKEVMGRLKTHQRGVVLNGGEGKSEIKDVGDLSCKLIAAPIMDDLGEVCGAVFVGKELEKPDFHNSDRSLVEVIARKVAKVLEETYDTLTGLLTRQGFEGCLARALDLAGEAAADSCLIYLDIDQTSLSAGKDRPAVGAVVLKQIAQTIRENLRNADPVGRLSDVVFTVLLGNCPMDRAYVVAEKLKSAITGREYVVEGAHLEVDLHVGIAGLKACTGGLDALLRSAEVAALLARERGGAGILAYDPEDRDLQRREAAAESVNMVRRALREDRFELWAQPIVPLRHDRSEGHLEVLLRLRDDAGGLLAPGCFMPAAEIYHLMPAIDRWVVKNALAVVEKYLAMFPEGNFHVAINLAGQSFRDTSLLDFIVGQLGEHNVPAERLCFEVTETTAMGQMAEARAFMEVLRERGCRFSLDDFGSGLSSFSYLKNLPVDFLKIDMEFVREILDEPVSAVIVDAVNRVAHAMGLRTVAEGVENDAIKGYLKEMGLDYVQGYGIAVPRPLEEVLDRMLGGRAATEQQPVEKGEVDVGQGA